MSETGHKSSKRTVLQGLTLLQFLFALALVAMFMAGSGAGFALGPLQLLGTMFVFAFGIIAVAIAKILIRKRAAGS